MAGRLEGKVAIVTGAGGGIGRAHALALAAQGASILVNDLGTRSGADAASVVAEIAAAGGHAVANNQSATWDFAPEIVGQALDAFGRIDILINNATAGGRPTNLWDVTEKDWDLAFDVNLKGYFAMIRAATPHFARQRSGVIINTSSGAGFGFPASTAYSAAKEGLIGLTRTVAREIGRFGVRCNAIRPLALGISSAQHSQSASKWTKLILLTTSPPGVKNEAYSVATPETHPPAKIAPVVVWLCTDAAKGVNGRTFHVRGDTVALLNEPGPDRVATRPGGWTVEALEQDAPAELIGGLENLYLLDDHPDLQDFDAAQA